MRRTIRFYRNESTKRWGQWRLNRMYCCWVGPLFVLITDRDAADTLEGR